MSRRVGAEDRKISSRTSVEQMIREELGRAFNVSDPNRNFPALRELVAGLQRSMQAGMKTGGNSRIALMALVRSFPEAERAEILGRALLVAAASALLQGDGALARHTLGAIGLSAEARAKVEKIVAGRIDSSAPVVFLGGTRALEAAELEYLRRAAAKSASPPVGPASPASPPARGTSAAKLQAASLGLLPGPLDQATRTFVPRTKQASMPCEAAPGAWFDFALARTRGSEPNEPVKRRVVRAMETKLDEVFAEMSRAAVAKDEDSRRALGVLEEVVRGAVQKGACEPKIAAVFAGCLAGKLPSCNYVSLVEHRDPAFDALPKHEREVIEERFLSGLSAAEKRAASSEGDNGWIHFNVERSSGRRRLYLAARPSGDPRGVLDAWVAALEAQGLHTSVKWKASFDPGRLETIVVYVPDALDDAKLKVLLGEVRSRVPDEVWTDVSGRGCVSPGPGMFFAPDAKAVNRVRKVFGREKTSFHSMLDTAMTISSVIAGAERWPSEVDRRARAADIFGQLMPLCFA